ncbi:MAG TPA: DUF4231 domain-containing protein [Nocardioidaceae bacterium]|nr:DUF4231 domain-containing protein [Nocardioidaceae bacterium]
MNDQQHTTLDQDSTWARLEDQRAWYDTKSTGAQRNYKRTKLLQLVVGSSVPVVALMSVAPAITATLAAVVVILEGTQQLYQWQTLWVQYRATAEALNHERFLYLAGAGPYYGPDRHRILAERVEGLVSQEHARWAEARQDSPGEGKASESAKGPG